MHPHETSKSSVRCSISLPKSGYSSTNTSLKRQDIWRPVFPQRHGSYGARFEAIEAENVPEIWDSGRNLLGLSKTCRRLARETLPVLYATTEFDLTSVLSVAYLLDTVPRVILEFITTLSIYCGVDRDLYTKSGPDAPFIYTNINTWERVWAEIAQLPALKQLTVFVNGYWKEYWPNNEWPGREWEEQMAEPLRKIIAPKVFWLAIILCAPKRQDPGPDESTPEPQIEDGPFRVLKLRSPWAFGNESGAWKLHPAHGTWSGDEYRGVVEYQSRARWGQLRQTN